MTALDALRPATPDSFDRAARLLRQPRPARRRPLVLAAVLAAAVGACAVPVEGERTVGTALSWTTYGGVGPGHYTVEALDRAVAPGRRWAIETAPAAQPAVPDSHGVAPGARWTRVRYTAAATDPDSVAAVVRALRAVLGAYDVDVEPVVQTRRMPLAAAAAGRLGLAVAPGDPAVSDRELQAFIDVHLDRSPPAPPSAYRRPRPRVARLPDGRRILDEGHSAFVMGPETRLWLRPDPDRPFDLEGVPYDALLIRTAEGWKTPTELGWPAPPGFER